ncbi:MAG: pentapeptide repeat-containing protein [Marinilabilia sp.]
MSTFLLMNIGILIPALVIMVVFLAFFLTPGWSSLDFFPRGKLNNRKNLVIRDEIYIKDIDLIQALKFKPDEGASMKAKVKCNMVFENCIFYGFKAFSEQKKHDYIIEFKGDLIFKNCICQDEVDLSQTTVSGNFNMTSCEFSERVIFKNAKFKGESSIISDCVFLNDVLFHNSRFEGTTLMEKNDFNLQCVFHSATFQKPTVLKDSVFYGYSEFENASFRSKIEMINVQFKGRTHFKNMKVKEPATLSKVRFARKCDLSLAGENIFSDLSDVDFEAGYFVPNGYQTNEQLIL